MGLRCEAFSAAGEVRWGDECKNKELMSLSVVYDQSADLDTEYLAA